MRARRQLEHGGAARPDPDALLARAKQEGQGRLKVFLGAAPGVGKTYEMLTEARRRALGGADVVIGLVETHGRAETAVQVAGLEVLPRARIAYRAQVLEEFDLDGALARRPAILVLDELPHSNAPGSRHPKRWQDVEELRAAGIEIWTAMNVQHLESLSEAVARITGVRVAETVPDHVLAGADAVELIDIPPAELLERLRQGRVYRPDQAARALKGFFREGNLAALREMALRRMAERVDADVTGYMRANAIAGPWPAGDRVMVLVGAEASAEGVVRHARRIADALRAPLVALHVEQPGEPDAGPAAAPTAALRAAETLGAETETVVDTDLPRAILAAARARNATHLVMGRGRPPLWRRLTGRTLSAVLLRRAADFTLHLVPSPTAVGRAPAAPERRAFPTWVGWASASTFVLGATAIGLALDERVTEGSLGMIYLAATVASAVGFGPVHGLATAVLSFLLWNYLFIEPRYTLTIDGPQEVVGALVFGLVALLLAGTAGRLGRKARTAQARVFGLRRLVEFSRRLGAPMDRAALLALIAEEAERVAGCPCCVLMPLSGEDLPGLGLPRERQPDDTDLIIRAAAPPSAEPDDASMAAARWAYAKGRVTGWGTDTLPTVSWRFQPLPTAQGVAGLIGFRFADRPEHLDPERQRTLDALLDQAAIALERAELMEERARGAVRAEADALRTTLLTSLGHDLRTPLTGIRGSLETLRTMGDALSPEARADLILAAEEETVRLTRFASNVLDMVRLESGQVALRREPVDLPSALEAAVERVEHATGRQVDCRIAGPLPAPLLDPVLFGQILANLLDNALKFSGAQGKVAILARRDGASVLVSVEDDGPGIPREDLARIFDPFFRASRTDRIAAGTGLGLAIARGLAVAMGGQITAESPIREGRGTRVTLRFAS
ncbi:two-component system, OmpR family, sensor histidine kinase KdpD [Roseomonas rosea]|uniref:histidine kinase n=1 Tax=Muricoccus roseus TaxID=198092 RepID=A0A1M6HP54_9PROT|nr:sensor histidine kinase KdpD [Roseomonas rosea]SHJ24002.1 two-component system, OmpR family, sensor histidine kinase KdpD [Roseomonas rosea]